MVNEFDNQLGEESLGLLRSLLGTKFLQVFTQHVQVEWDRCCVPLQLKRDSNLLQIRSKEELADGIEDAA